LEFRFTDGLKNRSKNGLFFTTSPEEYLVFSLDFLI
jgi:hypothetical protein